MPRHKIPRVETASALLSPNIRVGRIGVLLRKRCSRIILGHRKTQVLRPILGSHPHRP